MPCGRFVWLLDNCWAYFRIFLIASLSCTVCRLSIQPLVVSWVSAFYAQLLGWCVHFLYSAVSPRLANYGDARTLQGFISGRRQAASRLFQCLSSLELSDAVSVDQDVWEFGYSGSWFDLRCRYSCILTAAHCSRSSSLARESASPISIVITYNILFYISNSIMNYTFWKVFYSGRNAEEPYSTPIPPS